MKTTIEWSSNWGFGWCFSYPRVSFYDILDPIELCQDTLVLNYVEEALAVSEATSDDADVILEAIDVPCELGVVRVGDVRDRPKHVCGSALLVYGTRL